MLGSVPTGALSSARVIIDISLPTRLRQLSVSGGRELSRFAGQTIVWPAVFGGGGLAEKWRLDGVAISLEEREAEG